MPIYNRVIEKFDPKQFRIFAIALGEKRPIPRFSSSVDISYLTIRKTALETVQLNQRQQQGLRQRLRRVSKASASRQPGCKWCKLANKTKGYFRER